MSGYPPICATLMTIRSGGHWPASSGWNQADVANNLDLLRSLRGDQQCFSSALANMCCALNHMIHQCDPRVVYFL